MSFEGKNILITGGSSGIGLATARLFGRLGAHVWLMARDAARLEAALEQVRGSCTCADQRCGVISADVSDPEQAAAAVAQVVRSAGPPDILINSAGVTRPGYFHELDPAVFREIMEINYFGTLHMIRAVLPEMMRRRRGYIVNVASAAAFLPAFGYTAYSASKHAVRGLSEVLRVELKPYGVRVAIVYPPDTDTPQLAWEDAYKPPETRAMGGGVVLSADTVAHAIVRGIERNRYTITPGLAATAVYHLTNLLGDRLFPILDLIVRRAAMNIPKHEGAYEHQH